MSIYNDIRLIIKSTPQELKQLGEKLNESCYLNKFLQILHDSETKDAALQSKAILTLKNITNISGTKRKICEIATEYIFKKSLVREQSKRFFKRGICHEFKSDETEFFSLLLKICFPDVDERTPLLFLASRFKKWDLIRFLIAQGSSPNSRYKGNLLLYNFVWYNNEPKNIKSLINLGADPYELSDSKENLIHACGYRSVVAEQENKELLVYFRNLGIPINAKDKDGDTPLHIACQVDPSKVKVELFLGLGADMNIPNNAGDLPIHAAALKGSLEAVSMLIERNPRLINALTKANETPLHLSIERENYLIRKFLQKQGGTIVKIPENKKDLTSHYYFSFIHYHSYHRDLPRALAAMKNGARIDEEAPDKFTALDSALARTSALKDPDFKFVRTMLAEVGISFEKALAIKFYAHLLELKGSYPLNERCSINYEGLNYYYASQQVAKFGCSFFKTKSEICLQDGYKLSEEDCNWFAAVLERAPDYCRDPKELIKDIKKGEKPVMLFTGWDAHIVVVIYAPNAQDSSKEKSAYISGEIFIGNTGALSWRHIGVAIYSIKENRITEDKLIKVFQALQKNAVSSKGKEMLYDNINRELKLEHKEDISISAQKGGHCGSKSMHAGFVGIAYERFRKENTLAAENRAKDIGTHWMDKYVIPEAKNSLKQKYNIEIAVESS